MERAARWCTRKRTFKRECYQEVGSGTLDFPAILRTAADSGVQHYFVEQDESPADPLESLGKSYRYLRSVPW